MASVEGSGGPSVATRPPRELGPALRTGILVAMGVAAGVTLSLVTALSLGSPTAHLNALNRTGVPALRALQSTVAATNEFEQAITAAITTTGATRAANLRVVAESTNLQASSWQQYRGVAMAGRAERTLATTYETSAALLTHIGTSALAAAPGAPSVPGLLTSFRAQAASELNALGLLESTIYAPLVTRDAAAANSGVSNARQNVEIAFGVLVVFFLSIGAMLFKGARRQERSMSAEAATLRLSREQSDFEASLQRGLEMAPTQADSLSVLGRALALVAGDTEADLILAKSSTEHFEQVLATSTAAEAACSVTTPADCPACGGGQLRFFEDNALLDTCRFLHDRPPVWTICAPVNIAGQSVGVIRAQGQLGRPPPTALSHDLALVARKAGERIGTQQVLERTEEQARSDPLTGLPNRRAFEAEVTRRQLQVGSYVIAFADLDHFKLINDTYGHDVGDRALRTFAQVLRDAIRPGDLVSRHGGEEFVVLLVGCTVVEARTISDRVRTRLSETIGLGGVPTFTVSIGIAEREPGDGLAEVVARADSAMLSAKSRGRDRVVAVGDRDHGVPPDLGSLMKIEAVDPAAPIA